MAWSAIKQYVASKNVNWNLKRCIELIQEKVLLMGYREWEILCKKVKEIEEEYAKRDHVVDLVTEELIICIDEDCSEDDTGNVDGSDDNSSPEPSTSKRPCTSLCGDSSIVKYDDLMEGVLPLSDSDY